MTSSRRVKSSKSACAKTAFTTTCRACITAASAGAAGAGPRVAAVATGPGRDRLDVAVEAEVDVADAEVGADAICCFAVDNKFVSHKKSINKELCGFAAAWCGMADPAASIAARGPCHVSDPSPSVSSPPGPGNAPCPSVISHF